MGEEVNQQQRHTKIEIDAQIASEWLKAEFARIRESSNRRFGQHLRWSVYRIELAKREFAK